MSAVEAIYAGGVFKPRGEVSVPENQRVRLTIEPAEAAREQVGWLDAVKQFQQQTILRHGVLPDSTPDIAADRRRHG